MLFKHEFLALEKDARAFALVGAFMGIFALLERGVDNALGELLKLDGLSRLVLGKNMNFAAKLKTLRSLVGLAKISNETSAKMDMLAQRAGDYGSLRNKVAHSPFIASAKSDGVEFILVTATKKLGMETMDWSVDEFIVHFGKINDIDNELRSYKRNAWFQEFIKHMEDNGVDPGDLGRMLANLPNQTDDN